MSGASPREGDATAGQRARGGPPSDQRVDRVVVSAEAIAERMPALAAEIAAGLGPTPRDPVLVAVMTGALIFAADLVRQLPVPLRLGLATVSSYPGTATTSQGARLQGDLPSDLAGRDVILVDDILDSGRTLRLLQSRIMALNPASLRTCVLLRKTIPSALETPCDHIGFDIPDVFVVGYGLDYDGYYRNLPAVFAMVPVTS
ncbi:MAG: hypoxanthine phosphoribosyltransferase [Phycisphaeraceae bacterium]|nr:hypoxanthine phosphoribosyltransferase [Phycisphaeraceae bacterium]